MNFFERIITGRLFFSQRKKQDVALETSPDIIIKFAFNNQIYILEEFDINFNQEINDKGQPGGLPKGGIMSLTISETPDSALNEWILKDTILHSGEIYFLSNKNQINSSALLNITFNDAYCIGYKKRIKPQEGGMLTTFIISPRYVKIDGEEFENKWKDVERNTHRINIYSLDKDYDR